MANQYLIGSAMAAMEQFKYECATELGYADYANVDKGELPSRVNGAIGGEMVKRMVAIAEQTLAGGVPATSAKFSNIGNVAH